MFYDKKRREREELSSHIIWTGRPQANAAIRGLAYDITHRRTHNESKGLFGKIVEADRTGVIIVVVCVA